MFRAWDKNHKCFWYELPIGFELKLDGKIFLYDMPTEEMQLVRKTGYQDINKKDIYENDIVRIQGLDDIYKIDFINGCWLLVYCGILKNLATTYYLNAWQNDLIIIGNIYENPELLEQGRVTES